MFRHKNRTRTKQHNLLIASLLSFVAGLVNVAGFLSVSQLTTNVTGHFAFFIDEMFKFHFADAVPYFLFILFFFLGSFFSGLCIEIVAKINDKFIYRIPVIVESLLLLFVALAGEYYIQNSPLVIAYTLLFAMGLQNSLVTTISNASVRTTHLTGLFTDLGIEISKLIFYKHPKIKQILVSSIKLRLTIILFFFLGGFTGGLGYSQYKLHMLFLPIGLLLLGLVYDHIIISIKRQLH